MLFPPCADESQRLEWKTTPVGAVCGYSRRRRRRVWCVRGRPRGGAAGGCRGADCAPSPPPSSQGRASARRRQRRPCGYLMEPGRRIFAPHPHIITMKISPHRRALMLTTMPSVMNGLEFPCLGLLITPLTECTAVPFIRHVRCIPTLQGAAAHDPQRCQFIRDRRREVLVPTGRWRVLKCPIEAQSKQPVMAHRKFKASRISQPVTEPLLRASLWECEWAVCTLLASAQKNETQLSSYFPRGDGRSNQRGHHDSTLQYSRFLSITPMALTGINDFRNTLTPPPSPCSGHSYSYAHRTTLQTI